MMVQVYYHKLQATNGSMIALVLQVWFRVLCFSGQRKTHLSKKKKKICVNSWKNEE